MLFRLFGTVTRCVTGMGGPRVDPQVNAGLLLPHITSLVKPEPGAAGELLGPVFALTCLWEGSHVCQFPGAC